ncbi:MAG: amidase, partial [Alphaproteobacteria bacterium]|nr:amidase [Alphaproteobacteria bacterium]
MPGEIHELGAAELSAGFTAKDFSPVEVAETCLARIEALDSDINSFCLVDREISLAQAEESEARRMAGEPLSELDGVPVAIKDLLLTKGWP